MDNLLTTIDLIIKRENQLNAITKKPTDDSHLMFTRDDYQFTLVGKGKHGSRDQVVIKSKNINTGETEEFAYYRSNSEVGLWRACLFIVRGYFKGHDYITSSFVDIRIQNFINNNFDRLEQIQDTVEYCYYDRTKNNDLYKFLENENRVSEDPIFGVLSLCKAGSCFKSAWDIEYFKRTLRDTKEYEKELKDNLSNNSEIPLQDLLYGSATYKPLRDQIESLYTGMSKFLSKYFTIVSDPEYIGKNIIEYGQKGTENYTKFTLNFYEINIKNSLNDKIYKLVYAKYKFNKPGSNLTGTYYTIINIVPADSKITKYGLSDKIISAGTYIYKILEYKEQCNISDKERSVAVDKKHCYVFIGDFMTNVWPLNIINKKD